MASVLLICCFLLVINHLTEGAVITSAPVSLTAAPLSAANFTCAGTGNTLTWTVNNVALNDSVIQLRNITVTNTHGSNNLQSILIIIALPINDGIQIGCVIVSIPFQVAAVEVSLTIRGVSPIENLNLNFSTENSLLVSWSPPLYYLPSEIPPIYEVTVTNLGGFIFHANSSNITFIEVANVTECDTFNVSVRAFVYHYTSATIEGRNNGSCFIEIQKHSILYRNFTAYIAVTCIPLICSRTVLVDATYNGAIGSTTQTQFVISKSSGINLLLKNYTLTHLEPFKHYNITFKILNLLKNTEDMDSLSVSTYFVQDLNVCTYNGFIVVTCLFVLNSLTKGCHVILTDKRMEEESFNVSRLEGAIISVKYSGNYTLTVYDIVNGSIIGPAFEYPEIIEVIVPVLSTSISHLQSISSSYTRVITSDLVFVNSSSSVDPVSTMFNEMTVLQTSKSMIETIDLPSTTISVNNDVHGHDTTEVVIFTSVTIAFVVIILFMLTIFFIIFCLNEQKGTKKAKEIIEDNPAYGQVTQVANENVEISANPAYSSVILHYSNTDYETVF